MHINERGQQVFVGEEAIKGFLSRLAHLREGGPGSGRHKLQGRTTFQNLPISIENQPGSIRRSKHGADWEIKMKVPYGYIPGTRGVDGDALDVFVGPNEHAAFAYVVHAQRPDGKTYDEDKVMLGFDSPAEAEKVYKQHYDSPKFFGGIDTIPMWKFHDIVWIKKHTSQKLVASMRESRFLEGGPGSGPRFHVTHTRLVDKIKKEGLKPMQTSNWVKAGNKDRYGKGEVHTFTNAHDAARWAGKMDWDFNKDIGSGKISILKISPGNEKWERDDTDPISHGGAKGEWHKYQGHIPADRIEKSVPFTSEIAKQLTGMGDKEYKMESRRDPINAFTESVEHGVKGMRWGVTNPRKDAPLQRKAAQAQPNRTMNQMDVGKGLNKMAHTNNDKAVAVIAQRQNQVNQQALQQIQQKQQVQAQQAQQRGQRPPQPQQSHSDALEMLANLGFKLLDVAAPLLGVEGAEQAIKSVVMSPYGKKLLFSTNKAGQHQLSPADGGGSSTPAQNDNQRPAPANGRKPQWGANPASWYGSDELKKKVKTSVQSDRIENFMREGGPGSGRHPYGKKGEEENHGTTKKWDGKQETSALHTDKNGEYTPARKAEVHDPAIRKFETKPPQDKPVLKLIMGGTASGKTFVADHEFADLRQPAIVNTDLVRAELPEFSKVVGTNKQGLLQAESSNIRDKILLSALAHNNDVAVDAVGSSNLAEKMNALESAGYKIAVTYVHRPIAESLLLAEQRFQTTTKVEDKRRVPEEVTRDSHEKARGSLEEMMLPNREVKIYDGTGKFDKSDKTPPPLIFHRDASGKILKMDKEKLEKMRNAEEPKIPERLFQEARVARAS